MALSHAEATYPPLSLSLKLVHPNKTSTDPFNQVQPMPREFSLNSSKMRPILILTFCLWCVIAITCNGNKYEEEEEEGFVVRRENRKVLVSTENGELVAARVGSSYLVHFFTMDPNSLFLPVILHSDMVFYVQTGIL